MMLSSAVKNIILFPNILGLILSAVAVIVGFILSLILNKLLPQSLFSILGLGFFYDLPQYLQVVGSVGFVVTFFGSTGAFLDGRVGKCLLVMYTVTLTLAVALEIFMLSTLYMSHRGLGVQAPVASPLTVDLRHYDPRETKEDNFFNENNPRIINSNEQNDDGNTHLRNRRALPSFSAMAKSAQDAVTSIKHTVDDKAKSIKDKVSDAAGSIKHTVEDKAKSIKDKVSDTAGSIKDTVQDKAKSIKDKVSDTAGSIKDTVQDKATAIKDTAMSGVEKVKSGIESVTNLGLTLGETGRFLIGIFASLTPEEEERVKKIKPLLGKLTSPAFHLTKSKYIMIACVIVIILEIFFILLGLYLFTTKDERIEYVLRYVDP